MKPYFSFHEMFSFYFFSYSRCQQIGFRLCWIIWPNTNVVHRRDHSHHWLRSRPHDAFRDKGTRWNPSRFVIAWVLFFVFFHSVFDFQSEPPSKVFLSISFLTIFRCEDLCLASLRFFLLIALAQIWVIEPAWFILLPWANQSGLQMSWVCNFHIFRVCCSVRRIFHIPDSLCSSYS